MIVASFVSNNPVAASEIPELISRTYAALAAISGNCSNVQHRAPAVPIEDSVTPEYLICLEDGRKLRSLRRYLQRKYSLSPEDYRARWNLPSDYPIVAPAYSELRSAIAKRAVARLQSTTASPRRSPGSWPDRKRES
jgi:predicted transcriptional regulator